MKKISKDSAREKLNIPQNKFVIFNFENVQTKENAGFVNSVFNLCRVSSKYLLIAGDYNYESFIHVKRYFEKLKNRYRERNNLLNKKYIFRPIKEIEIPYFFSASDAVLIGDSIKLTPGNVALAATYGKPVIYPKIGCYYELSKNWASIEYKSGNIKEAAHTIKKLFENLKENKINLDNSQWLKENSWGKYVQMILEEFNKVRTQIN